MNVVERALIVGLVACFALWLYQLETRFGSHQWGVPT